MTTQHVKTSDLLSDSISYTMENCLYRSCSSDSESTTTASVMNEKQSKKRVRRYADAFLEYGFTSVFHKNEEKPKCLICLKVLSSKSMKPDKLKQHLETVHKEYSGKQRSFFQCRKRQLSRQHVQCKRPLSSEQAERASFEVSYRIARARKPPSIAETLIFPAALNMVKIMCGETEANKLKAVLLSENTVKLRIEAIAVHQEAMLVERLKCTLAYALQIAVSTEGQDTYVLAFVRYIWEDAILEDILYCLPLPERETAEGIFNVLQSYLVDKNIPWDRLVGFCTDRASPVAGLRTLVKRVVPSAVWSHSMIHWEQLAAKLSMELGEVLQQVTSIVTYIKPYPLFAKLCDAMGPDYDRLLCHTEVHWMLRGKILERFFELRDQLLAFAVDFAKTEFIDFMCDDQKMCHLAYIADILGKLRELNASVQGKNTSIIQLSNRITAFMEKIAFWKKNMLNLNYSSFPQLSKFLSDNEIDKCSTRVMIEHLCCLQKHFTSFFPDLDVTQLIWVQNPFLCQPEDLDLPVAEIEQLIDISCDYLLQGRHSQVSLSEFWFSVRNEYPEISMHALKLLVPFASTYLCDKGLSALVYLKSLNRSTLEVTSEIRCAISTTPPDFEKLCCNLQTHVS
ncbi:zinc finger BED domain-containing protein 5-like [Rhinatrema bivittatum]|uniref:zinc finger BED domain-containing protein 5-like n=1 Tax=Rhinatrema bivittatum TaxID=194408 RepID=UPI0011260D64|nr:zinc finger BED domain-containing protein 5-like [Rhinatrema bivittatum]